jgi:pimeloyl-ACP methyl ester carboxylesterase
LRSGEQAALGDDLRQFIERLAIARPIVAGYDWGGRAACVVSALWPQLVAGLVSCNSYNIQDIASSIKPLAPDQEQRLWYQYYFNLERGRHGLELNRQALCKLLWQLWSPSWSFSDASYAKTAESFENPDFVDVVIHSYRHRFGLVPGDAALAEIERQLAQQPLITVPSVTLDGSTDGVSGGSTAHHAKQFSGRHEHLTVAGAGHNLPQEAPQQFAQAVLKLRGWIEASNRQR